MFLCAIRTIVISFSFESKYLHFYADCGADGNDSERETERGEAAENRDRLTQTQTGPEDTGQIKQFNFDS